jgi:hypothetical protein
MHAAAANCSPSIQSICKPQRRDPLDLRKRRVEFFISRIAHAVLKAR